jgi:hypothetical protein
MPECLKIILLLLISFLRLVSSSALVAAAAHDGPVGPVNYQECLNLIAQGDHLFAEERRLAEEAGSRPSLLASIPSHFKLLLSRAFGELHLLDDLALILSYLNGKSPYDYPDESKVDQALLLLPSMELINHDRDVASSENARIWALANHII